MQQVFAVDNFPCLLVGRRFPGARVGRSHKGDIVHPQAREIILVGEIEALAAKDFAISFQMDSFVIDDDAVEVEKDRLDHVANESTSSPPHLDVTWDLFVSRSRWPKRRYDVRNQRFNSGSTSEVERSHNQCPIHPPP